MQRATSCIRAPRPSRSQPPYSATRQDHGYTLTEVVVTLALIGIVVAAGVTGFRSAIAGEQVDGWARSMTMDLAAARQAAIAMRSAVAVTLSSSSYLIAASTGVPLRRASVPPDISITTTCPSGVCSFDRRGWPTTAGTITLTSASTGRSYVITIQPDTGSVSYQ